MKLLLCYILVLVLIGASEPSMCMKKGNAEEWIEYPPQEWVTTDAEAIQISSVLRNVVERHRDELIALGECVFAIGNSTDDYSCTYTPSDHSVSIFGDDKQIIGTYELDEENINLKVDQDGISLIRVDITQSNFTYLIKLEEPNNYAFLTYYRNASEVFDENAEIIAQNWVYYPACGF